jgi:GrpB-like predicted nucleotidyltransferase (UPF0157 family)
MIELVPYDPTWPARFDEEAARLQAVCGALALRIDHVGSTSIPGIAAKLVIDVQITVGVLEPLREWQDRLARLGYSYLASRDDDEYPFFHRPAVWPHTRPRGTCADRGA